MAIWPARSDCQARRRRRPFGREGGVSEEDAIKAAIGDAIKNGAIAGASSPHPALDRVDAEFNRLRNAYQQPSSRADRTIRRLRRALLRVLTRGL